MTKRSLSASPAAVHGARKLDPQLEVDWLRQQIRQLELQRALLLKRSQLARQDHGANALETAQRYFRLFRHGGASDEQRLFLDQVCEASLGGRLLQLWQQFTQDFALRFATPPVLRVTAYDEDDACVVRAHTTFHGVFTEQTLATASFDACSRREPTKELHGSELVLPATFRLQFDERGRLVRHDVEMDYFSALATALGDATQAAAMLQQCKSVHAAREEGDAGRVKRPRTTELKTGGGQSGESKRRPTASEAASARLSIQFLLS